MAFVLHSSSAERIRITIRGQELVIHPLSPREMAAAKRAAGVLSKAVQDAVAARAALVAARVDAELREVADPLSAEAQVRARVEAELRLADEHVQVLVEFGERISFELAARGIVSGFDVADLDLLPVDVVEEIAAEVQRVSSLDASGKA